jgi:hypothetical protein
MERIVALVANVLLLKNVEMEEKIVRMSYQWHVLDGPYVDNNFLQINVEKVGSCYLSTGLIDALIESLMLQGAIGMKAVSVKDLLSMKMFWHYLTEFESKGYIKQREKNIYISKGEEKLMNKNATFGSKVKS